MGDVLYNIIIFPITQILEVTFSLSQLLFSETGISVIFISVVISVLCLPLYTVAEKWQQREREVKKQLQTKTDKIKTVFSGDEQYMILSTFYRQNHYHPVYALRGSFGLIIQIPFFIAAYSYLSHLEILKNVPFFFINSLSDPDALLNIGGFRINLLPLVMTLINCLSGAVYTRGLLAKDKVQLYGMAGIFLILLYNSPAALVLYWTMNNIFSLIKNIYYKVQLRYKKNILFGIFSVICILLAAYILHRYGHNRTGRKLIFICCFAAIIPWITIIFRRLNLKFIELKYNFRESFVVFLLSVSLVWAFLGLLIPTQLVVSSPQEFSFVDKYNSPLFFIFNTSVQAFGFFILWPICLYLLFSDKTKSWFSAVFFMISVCMMVNILFFPGKYGNISIDMIFDERIIPSAGEIWFNILIMALLLSGGFALTFIKNKKIIITFVSFFIFSVLSVSIVNIFRINSAFMELKSYYVKEESNIEAVSPLFPLSKNGNNIVVIMLDRAISGFIPIIFEETPELNQSFSGFTYYPNTVSFYAYTSLGAPPVYGGYEYTPEEINKRSDVSLTEKNNQALIMLPLILSGNGYTVCVTDPPYANYNWKSDLNIFNNYQNIEAYITDGRYTDLWLSEHDLKLPETSTLLKRNMFWYSLFRSLPLMLREPVYLQGTWCSPSSGQSLRQTLNGYSVLDYLPRLTKIMNDNSNTALVMTNNTTHEKSFLQAPEYTPVIPVTDYGNTNFSKESAYHINAAAIKRLSEWFTFLKNENIYDNTRIILVSDHGPIQNYITKTDLPFNLDQYNPLLMIKDFNASGGIETNMEFMSNADVPYLALLDIVDSPKNPFTGNDISINRKKEPLYISMSATVDITDKEATQFSFDPGRDYLVHTNIFDPKNWEKAEK